MNFPIFDKLYIFFSLSLPLSFSLRENDQLFIFTICIQNRLCQFYNVSLSQFHSIKFNTCVLPVLHDSHSLSQLHPLSLSLSLPFCLSMSPSLFSFLTRMYDDTNVDLFSIAFFLAFLSPPLLFPLFYSLLSSIFDSFFPAIIASLISVAGTKI